MVERILSPLLIDLFAALVAQISLEANPPRPPPFSLCVETGFESTDLDPNNWKQTPSTPTG
jgi:hypothetical protein